MSISISSIVNFEKQHRSNSTSGTGLAASLSQLNSALNSGSLGSANLAFSAVQANLQSLQNTASAAGVQSGPLASQLQQGLSQIGAALKAGNVSGAETDYTNLKQQVQSALSQGVQQAKKDAHFHFHQPGAQPSSSASITEANLASLVSGTSGHTSS